MAPNSIGPPLLTFLKNFTPPVWLDCAFVTFLQRNKALISTENVLYGRNNETWPEALPVGSLFFRVVPEEPS
jgi:hypothetical protein